MSYSSQRGRNGGKRERERGEERERERERERGGKRERGMQMEDEKGAMAPGESLEE